jgi:adenylate cyclase
MQTAADRPYSFAGFSLDLRQGCLRAGDRQIELRPKSFALLRYLVENAVRLVPKDELVNAIWPSVIVTDESLTRCVSDVRLALDDGGQCLIKTVPRRGYLLTAPVSRLEPPVITPSQDQDPDAARQRPAERRQPTFMAIVAASIMVVAGALWWWLGSPGTSPSATVISATAEKAPPPPPLITAVAPSAALAKLAAQSAPRMSIVVLPFTNLSGDPSQEYFADGFTENLTTDLSRISGSFVIARTTANTYKGKTVSEKAIASELGVRYVLEGGVQKAGDHVRVNAQLIDGETGGHLWAERYDRDSADFLQMQDEITNQIANALGVTLDQSESDRSWRDHSSNPNSVDLTQRANALLNGPVTPTVNANLRRLYEQALELDPKNVDALVGLAGTYTQEIGAAWAWDESKAQKRIDSALTRALALNPRSASAYQVKSEAFTYDTSRYWRGELAKAIEAAETALALKPNRADTLAWLGRLYAKVGHPERTTALVEQAIRLSPRDPHMHSWLYILGMSQLQMGDNDDAIKSFQKALLLHPRMVISWAGLTGALYAAGRDREAHDALIKWLEFGVTEGGYRSLDYSLDTEILKVRVQLALLRLGRWPYTLNIGRSTGLAQALFEFQADENLPQTGQPDEATLARLGMPSQVKAITERAARAPLDRW